MEQVPFIDEITLPTELPEGLNLVQACWSGTRSSVHNNVNFFYSNAAADSLVFSALKFPEATATPSAPEERIELGHIEGRASETTEGGVTTYAIVFVKGGRHYALAAKTGPSISITRDDVNQVARSIAEN